MRALETFIEYQEASASLYKLFADKNPLKRDFWLALHMEKKLLTRWMRTIYLGMGPEKLGLMPGRLDMVFLQNCINFITTQIAAWKKKELTFAQALLISIKVESVLLQKGFFNRHQSDAPMLKQLLGSLERSYLNFYGRLKEALEIVG
ncbi:MAG: hypothetical protein JW867_04035 [Candidatus Omnitrophica bacterium]|nr:hypothetical protein [Candidatus Omnitrophota bacterium]